MQRPRQVNVGMPHRHDGGLAADGIGRRVHANGLQIARARLQVLDDIAIAVMGSKGPDAEIGPTVGTGLAQKAGLVGLGHAANETDAPGAMKLMAQVVETTIVAEQLARQIVPGDHHHITHADQAVFVDAQPVHDLIADVFGHAVQGTTQLLVVALGQMTHGQTGQHDAEEKNPQTPAQA